MSLVDGFLTPLNSGPRLPVRPHPIREPTPLLPRSPVHQPPSCLRHRCLCPRADRREAFEDDIPPGHKRYCE